VDAEAAQSLRRLIERRPIAALGTLHQGEPAVSMVPIAWLDGGTRIAIHVSTLAPHTLDMRGHPRVGVLVMDEPGPQAPAQAVARVALQADAQFLERESPEYETARAVYLGRFPEAGITFDLGDFSLVTLKPRSARLVAGFGRAQSLAGEALDRWLRSGLLA
jgi:heme iron utilization protein